MPRCPYCDEWFKTKKGLKVHITKAHTTEFLGGRILDVTTFKFDLFSKKKKN